MTIISIIFSILCISLLLVIFIIKKKKAKNFIFDESNFSINTKVNKLSQFLMNSTQIHNSITNKINSNYSLFSKTIYDIYTLNESYPEKDIDLYSKIYKTVIIINSKCNEFTENKTNCQLEKYLDLTIQNQNNLRRNNENIEELKKVILPLCIIEHSDTNIILSINCPETLSDNLKNNLISSFKNIKPNLSKTNFQDYNLRFNNIDEQVDINIGDKECDNKNQNCEININIIADKDGNLIKSSKKSKFEMIKNDENKYNIKFNYSFEDISCKKNNSIEESNFIYNLNIILELIKPLMKIYEIKNINISNNLTNNDLNNSNRILDNAIFNNFGIREESYFLQSLLFGVNLEAKLKNDFDIINSENIRLISNYLEGTKTVYLHNNIIFTNINKTINEFVAISKAGNLMINSLYNKINSFFTNFTNTINLNFNDLNNLLNYKDLSFIFDSSLAIGNLNQIPYSVISASQKLFFNIFQINNSLEESIRNITYKLNSSIQSFIINSHELLDNLVNNVTELSDTLYSNEGKITEILKYYLKYEDSSYHDVFLKAKLLMENYYINETNLIEPLLKKLLNEFSSNFNESIIIYQNILKTLIIKLKNKSLSINLGSHEEIINVINNLSNITKMLNQIQSNIQDILKRSIRIKEDGYFESNEELNNNKNLFQRINDKAINISYILDNNLIVDKTFDNIIQDFKNNITNFLNYVEKSKIEKFPLKNNIVLNSSYILNLFDKMDKDFEEEKLNILNYIKRENNEYLDLNKKMTESFFENNKLILDKIITEINNDLSQLNLYNINEKYYEILLTIMNSINNTILYNYNLGYEYLTNVKNAEPTRYTELFVSKYNTFLNSLIGIQTFIENNLATLFKLRYKNIYNIKIYLQNIKTNIEINIKKYYIQMSFIENHLIIIDNKLKIFKSYFSDDIFNSKFLPIINNYVSNTVNNIIQYRTNLYNIYIQVTNLPLYSSNTYDYYKITTRCQKLQRSKIVMLPKECSNLLYTVTGTNNHLKLQALIFNEWVKDFDTLINDINSKLLNNQTLYTNNLNIYGNNFNSIIDDISNKKNYLKILDEKINYFISDEISNNITILAYDYFQKEINSKLNKELNNIFFYYKKIFDEIINKTINNIGQFKYSIEQLGILVEQYYKIYFQNISKDYINSIIEQRKHDFNYTLKYFYNMLLLKVNKTYSYILNNIPINEGLFNYILNVRNNEIQKSYDNFINKIILTKNKYSNIKIQLDIIKVNNSDFFNINDNVKKYN